MIHLKKSTERVRFEGIYGGRQALVSRGSLILIQEYVLEHNGPGVWRGNLLLDFCVLSREEAGRLENWGIWPTCKSHRHIKKIAGLAAVEASTHRFVGGPDTKVKFISAITPIDCSQLWQPVQCHSEDGAKLAGMRTWGLRPIR